MSEHKIDHLFQEALHNRRESPRAEAWERLEDILEENHSQTKRLMLYRALRIAAIFLFVLLPQMAFWQLYEKQQTKNAAFTLAQKEVLQQLKSHEKEKVHALNSANTIALQKMHEENDDKSTVRNPSGFVQEMENDVLREQKKQSVASVEKNDNAEKESKTIIKTQKVKEITMAKVDTNSEFKELIPSPKATITEVEVPSLGLAEGNQSTSSNEIKVIINLSQQTINTEQEKPSAIGKFWNKLKQLPIGESD